MADHLKPRTYRTNGEAARRARERTGLTQEGAKEAWEIGERTIRDIESGKGASPTKIRIFAEKCGISNWHELLADEEKTRLGVGRTDSPPTGSSPVSAGPMLPTVVNRLFQLPAVVADFTGREDEIRQMVGLLRGDGRPVGVSALRGMGGVGKTSLAVKAPTRSRTTSRTPSL